jgi:hypothetical protein
MSSFYRRGTPLASIGRWRDYDPTMDHIPGPVCEKLGTEDGRCHLPEKHEGDCKTYDQNGHRSYLWVKEQRRRCGRDPETGARLDGKKDL